MGKLLVLLLLALGAYLVFKGVTRPRPRPPRDATKGAGERMVTCARCGLNLPESDSLSADGRFYCSEAHRRLDV